ncbi:hypothetical protein [uncultured Tenacibaculum sp.]|uniref:hypothetical protein n=1 Tax=uncultured Tenacibaculum sp. TaxID=174713 RepID=UPI002624748A|nr:hypothetical protein [uncultured Tenacibaculum sp.]
MNRILLLLILYSFFSCSKSKTENFLNFSLEIPKNWTVHQLKGTDSYVRLITTEKNDSIYMDYGMYSNSLKYYPPIIAPLKKKKMILSFGLKESEVIFLDKDSITKKDRGFYKDRIELYETINEKKAKIVFPKKGKKGLGGVYFENFKNNNKLTIYGNNLNNEKSLKLIEVIKTIKLKKN